MNRWYELEKELRVEIKDRTQEIKEHKYPEDILHEIVDAIVPIYNSELLEIALDNMSVCFAEDEGLYSNDMDIFKRLQIGIYEQLLPIAHEVFGRI